MSWASSGAPRHVAVDDRYVRVARGSAADGGRPLLNHLALLVDDAHGVPGRGRGRGPRDRRREGRREHVRGLPARPRGRARRVRRAQAGLRARLSLRPRHGCHADLIVAGAGMAGLAAAAEARRLGADPLVVRSCRAGRLDAAVERRDLAARGFEPFREECPEATSASSACSPSASTPTSHWLESLGAPVVERETGNPLTTGTRFDPGGMTEALVEGPAIGTARPREVLLATSAPPAPAARPRHRRVRGQPGPSARARVPRGGRARPARGTGEHGRRAPHRARGRRADERGPRPGLRARDARAAGAHRRARPRSAVPALREARDGHERAGERTRRAHGPRPTSRSGARQPRARAWFTVPNDRLAERSAIGRQRDGRRRGRGRGARPARR